MVAIARNGWANPGQVDARPTKGPFECRRVSPLLQEKSRGGMIVTVQGHLGVPHLLAALGLSTLLFKAKWKACMEAGPRSILVAALFVVGVFTLVVVSGR